VANSEHSSAQVQQSDDAKQQKQSSENIAVNKRINQLLQRWQRQFLQQQVLLFIPKCLALVIAMLFVLLSGEFLAVKSAILLAFLLIVAALVSKLMLIRRSKPYLSITRNNLIAHFNDRFPSLENSTQLLFNDAAQLAKLEQLQYAKIQPRFTDILRQQAQDKYPNLSPIFAKQQFFLNSVVLVFLLLLLTALASFHVMEKTSAWYQSQVAVKPIAEIPRQLKPIKAAIEILSQQVTIQPPEYSLTKHQPKKLAVDSLDIKALVGSIVRWRFSFSEQVIDYFIVFSSGERHLLAKQNDGSYSVQVKLTTSMVYHLATADENIPLSDGFTAIHRITVTPDHAPKIRFIQPKNSVTEYAKNSVPNVVTEVQISDDFAVTEVEILASIAKGSGEGVKFRDQKFSFDRSEQFDGKGHYYKTWSLPDLAMEPGDELYFTILARDNRQPENQQSRSATKVIRWLEDEQTGVNADGILIDFMPEYFKSQRQIIIETIELIEDKAQLTDHDFVEKSELLGVAQSALKEKYGQYLGDESEGPQSVGVTLDNDHSAGQAKPQIQVHDEHGGSNAVITTAGEKSHNDMPSHEHVDAWANKPGRADLSGKMALINRYGHNHEDSDVGVMTSQDPKALMKKSLSNMWQAELHLMLSEPELALPYEQQALKLLRLAKKAERIYVKRLGFEPPPVTEQRRYQGEQADILVKTLQVSRFNSEQLSNQTQLAFTELLQLLQRFTQSILPIHSSTQLAIVSAQQTVAAMPVSDINSAQKHSYADGQLSPDELVLVETAKQGLVKLIAQRPALVEALAVVEQILLERQLKLSQCEGCLSALAGTLEQLIPSAIAAPRRKAQDFFDQQPLIEHYGEFLEEHL